MKNICIITNISKDPNRRYFNELTRLLSEKGMSSYSVDISFNKEISERLISEELVKKTDCIIVLGGDGTLLETARKMTHTKIPLIGINLGHLGFLTETEGADIAFAVDKIYKNEYFIENRMMIKGTIERNNKIIYENIALNDIVFGRKGQNQITELELNVNGSLLNIYVADGLIISTPTGSTAYNHSAGGPVVKPTASMIVVTPICSQILGIPSILLDGDDELEIYIPDQTRKPESDVGVSFDGENMFTLLPGDKIKITRFDNPVNLLRLSKQSFLETLSKKMQH